MLGTYGHTPRRRGRQLGKQSICVCATQSTYDRGTEVAPRFYRGGGRDQRRDATSPSPQRDGDRAGAPVREDRPRFREEVETEMEFHLCPRNISLFLSPPSIASCPREAWKPFWSFRSKSPLHAPVLESLHTSSRLERSRGTQYARF